MSVPESAPSADRNLLFGILAVQMDFVSRDALITAMNAWVLQKSTPLGQILLDQGALRVDTHALLEALVQKHLEMHGGDAQKSLASVSSLGSARQQLEQIADPDLHQSLAHVASKRAGEDDVGAMRLPTTVGEPTSAGQRFRILRPHARGGLGEVFVAHDSELGREVALKEIQDRYADDPHRRTRFVLEAEITGGLEHPGIVPVYGLGQYADGRPFYAMRFIRGDSLQDAIRRFHEAENPGRDPGERSLSLRQLLGRFVDVCDAVAYAHSRGVLHRDLKPGNIMLGPYGETLVVDWGLAKPQGGRPIEENGTELDRPLQPQSGSSATPTQMGAALGTPAYMPPEQAAGRLDQLGPASDVYSLGATLYCLLTGKAPFGGQDHGEILRRVQQGELRPPRSLKPSVPAALEAVCLKAMALKPEDRYASVRALARDIEHWLADEPVSACREPWQVRARRWVGRHRTLVTTAAATLLVATVSLTAATILLQEAYGSERQANDEKEAALRRVQEQAAIALAVNEFLQKDLLGQADIGQQVVGQQEERDPDVKVRTILDRASKSIEGKFKDQPLTEAAIHLTIGDAYRALARYPESQRHLEYSVRLRTGKLGADHPETLTSKHVLAGLYESQGRFDLAEPLLKEVLKVRTAKLGADHADTLTSKDGLAMLYWNQGKYGLAEPLCKEVLQRRTAKLGANHTHTLISKQSLAAVYWAQRKYDPARTLYQEALQALTAKHGADHPQALIIKASLAIVYQAQGKYELAEPLLNEVAQGLTVKLGVDHPDTLKSKHALAVHHTYHGKYDLAELLFKEVAQGLTAKLGADHPSTLHAKNNLAVLYRDQGKYDLAEPLLKEVLNGRRAKLGSEHDSTLLTIHSFSYNLVRQKKYTEAEPILRDYLTICEKKQPNLWTTFSADSMLGEALAGKKKYAEAEPLLLQGYEGMKQRENDIPPHYKPWLIERLERLVQLYDAWGKKDKAEEYRKKLAEERAKLQPAKK